MPACGGFVAAVAGDAADKFPAVVAFGFELGFGSPRSPI
jgi:hypothetical protein